MRKGKNQPHRSPGASKCDPWAMLPHLEALTLRGSPAAQPPFSQPGAVTFLFCILPPYIPRHTLSSCRTQSLSPLLSPAPPSPGVALGMSRAPTQPQFPCCKVEGSSHFKDHAQMGLNGSAISGR